MKIDVRTITDAEVEAYTVTMNLGFNSTRSGEAEVRRGGIDSPGARRVRGRDGGHRTLVPHRAHPPGGRPWRSARSPTSGSRPTAGGACSPR